MKTCGFCATELQDKYCSFCDMELLEQHIMTNGKRMNQAEQFTHLPDPQEIYSTTTELMEKETIELLCLLKEARKIRADMYQLRLLRHQAEEENGMNEDVRNIEEQTYSEYENATRKVWVLENIIKKRLGYFPKRLTQNFLNGYLQRMEESEEKPMILRRSIKKKYVQTF